MSDGIKSVEKDHYLFREGDQPDAMYVLKSGKLAVVKSKQNSEIVLAELVPGNMVGEMAFFDNKPRSAGCKALKDSEVIILPYKSLHAQFQNFPEWLKAIVKTVNEHLRNANQRIKQLEKADTDGEIFPPHTITKLTSILCLVTSRYGKPAEGEALALSFNKIRDYTIQVFQEPTHKMQKLLNSLMELGFLKVEDLGEGRQRVTVLKLDELYSFTEWYNEWLFKKEAERIVIKEEDLKLMQGLVVFTRALPPDDKGNIKINLTQLQNDSMKDLGFVIKIEDINPLIEKKVVGEKTMQDDQVFVSVQKAELERVTPFWNIIYTLKKIKNI